jgi:hypothetical protein
MFYRIVMAALSGASLCAAQCSLDMVRGTWAGYYTGYITMSIPGSSTPVPTPAAQLIVEKIDYQGRMTGSGYANVGGKVISGTFTGNYQVNPDCTGSDTFNINVAGMGPLPGTGVERVLILSGGAEMRAMATAGQLGGPVGTGVYRRVSWGDPQCTQDMARGGYAVTWDGVWLGTLPGQSQPAPFPYSQIGVAAFDYAGNGTGAATMSVGGNMADLTLPQLALSVNADCTGAINYKGGPKGSPPSMSGVNQIVLLNNGDEFLELPTQASMGSPIAIGRARRISTLPVAPNW